MALDNQTYVKLNNGIEMPQFGMGVFTVPEGPETVNAVAEALPDMEMRKLRDIEVSEAGAKGILQSLPFAPKLPTRDIPKISTWGFAEHVALRR